MSWLGNKMTIVHHQLATGTLPAVDIVLSRAEVHHKPRSLARDIAIPCTLSSKSEGDDPLNLWLVYHLL